MNWSRGLPAVDGPLAKAAGRCAARGTLPKSGTWAECRTTIRHVAPNQIAARLRVPVARAGRDWCANPEERARLPATEGRSAFRCRRGTLRCCRGIRGRARGLSRRPNPRETRARYCALFADATDLPALARDPPPEYCWNGALR